MSAESCASSCQVCRGCSRWEAFGQPLHHYLLLWSVVERIPRVKLRLQPQSAVKTTVTGAAGSSRPLQLYDANFIRD